MRRWAIKGVHICIFGISEFSHRRVGGSGDHVGKLARPKGQVSKVKQIFHDLLMSHSVY